MPQPSALKQAQREGRARLHPSMRNPNWLILRRRRVILESGLDRLAGSALCVLDIGGRLQPYRPLLVTRTKNYLAVDLQIAPLVDVGAAAEALPFRDGQFDFVICTQVFEYLPDPALVVAEIRRVLRNGGTLFLSAPSVFLRNNEKECWRFLPEAWRYLLREFEAVEVVAEGNSLAGFFRTCNVCLLSFLRPRFLAPLWQWTVVPFLNLAGYVLGPFAGENQEFTANYSVWARK
jgi:SAM-dependent methyltransferase